MNKILDSIRGSKEIVLGLAAVILNVLIVLIPATEQYKGFLGPLVTLALLLIAGFVTAKDIADKFTASGKIDFESLVTEVFAKIQELVDESKSPVKTDTTSTDAKG